MIKRFLKKYCGVMLFYMAIVGVAYILCNTNINVSTIKNNNSLRISVNN